MQSHALSPRRSQPVIWLSTLLLLLAFGLRIWRAAHDSFWFDEAFTAWMVRLPIQEMVARTAYDTAPPLYYIALSGWRILFGEQEIALKMLSVFSGMLTVAMSYQIGREAARRSDNLRLGQQAGLAGMLLVTVAWPQVWSSQEVRQYGMMGFLAVLCLWAALRLFNDPKRPWLPAWVLAISMGAGLLTHYLFAQVPLILNLVFVYVFLAARRRWKLISAWALAQVVALAMLIPWLLYSWGTIRRGASGGPLELWPLVTLYLSVIFVGVEADLGRYVLARLVGIIGLISAGAASLVATQRRQLHGWIILVLGTVLPVILIYISTLPAIHFYNPPSAGRYLILLAPAVYILLGWGMAALSRLGRKPIMIWAGRVAATGLIALLASLSIWRLERYYPGLRIGDDYLSLAATLETLRQPDDTVILSNDTDWPVFAYHYPDKSATYLTQQTLWTPQDAERLLTPLMEKSDGIWLVQNRFGPASDPRGYVRQTLEAHARAERHYTFPEVELWFYALTDARAAPNRLDQVEQWPTGFVRHDASIADGVWLTGYTCLAPEIDAGSNPVIGLGWHVEAGITGQWTVAVKISDKNGSEIGSTLVTLDGTAGDHFTPVKIFVPPDTPAGQIGVAFLAGPYYSSLTTMIVHPTSPSESMSSAVPASATTLGIRYGDGIILKAAELPHRVTWRPGENIPLTLYWQPIAAIPERYKVFVHLIGDQVNAASGNTLWGQQDQEPQGGMAQTLRWLPGEMITDNYAIAISNAVPPGHYTLQVGLYPLLGGPRLPATDQAGGALGDSVAIFELEIEP